MPCRDYQDDFPRTVEVENPETRKQLEASLARNDELSRLLCYVVTKAVENDLEHYVLNSEVRDWYIQHRQADLDNMQNLLESVDIDSIPKEDFDKLDALLSKYQTK